MNVQNSNILYICSIEFDILEYYTQIAFCATEIQA